MTYVNLSSRLMWALGAVQLVTVGVALVVVFGDSQDRVARALAGGPQDLGEVGALVVVVGAMVSAAVALPVAVAAAILAGPVGRGSRPARIATWVTGLLVLGWAGAVAAVNPAGGPLSLFAGFADTNGTLTGAELQERVNAALPGWYQPVHISLALVTVAVAAAVLTSLSASSPES
jgi:hypothetical protein